MRMWLGWALAVAVFCSSSHASGERRVALVVGNGSYKAVSPLRNPIKDANLMRRTLKGAGFEVTMVLDAGDKALRKAVIDFGLRLEDADVGLFYYAGHGIQLDGANYLVPIDAKLARRDYLEIEALNVNNVLKRMGAAGNRLNIVVLDACRNNPFPAFSRAPTRGLAVTRAPSGTYIAYATRPGDVAVDGQGANSPFTAALARALPTRGASLEQVFKQVRAEVRRRTGGEQIPWTSSSIEGEFFFHKAKPKQDTGKKEREQLAAALKKAKRDAELAAKARAEAEAERTRVAERAAESRRIIKELKARVLKARERKSEETKTVAVAKPKDPFSLGDSSDFQGIWIGRTGKGCPDENYRIELVIAGDIVKGSGHFQGSGLGGRVSTLNGIVVAVTGQITGDHVRRWGNTDIDERFVGSLASENREIELRVGGKCILTLSKQ